MAARKPKKKWVRTVTTDSTHPPPGLFTKGASTIARVLASKKVSPKGPASGMRMLTYFMNRGGKGLSAERRVVLERAKTLALEASPGAARNSGKTKELNPFKKWGLCDNEIYTEASQFIFDRNAPANT